MNAGCVRFGPTQTCACSSALGSTVCTVARLHQFPRLSLGLVGRLGGSAYQLGITIYIDSKVFGSFVAVSALIFTI